jgi:hypothetical protein
VRRQLGGFSGTEIMSHEEWTRAGLVRARACRRSGAARDAFAHARSVLEIELNAGTDNPLVRDDTADGAGEVG